MLRILCALMVMSLVLTGCSSEDDSAPEVVPLNLELVVVDKGEPVPNATITTLPETRTAVTNAEGYAILKNIEAGDYLVRIIVDDLEYQTNVTVASAGENKYTIVLESIDPIGEASVDYEQLFTTIYEKLKGDTFFDARGYVSYWGDIGVDVCSVNQDNFSYDQLDRYNLSTVNSLIEKVWVDHYFYMYLINDGLDHLEVTARINPDLNAAAIAGELRFLRALLYFNLVKIYGNPILVTTAEIDLENPSATVQGGGPVYDQIIADLAFAEENLAPVTNTNRASQEAAQALLGKVYLQSAGFPMNRKENYAKALQEFAKLEGKFELENNYAALFDPKTETSTEIIFKIDFGQGENKGNYGVFWGPQGQSLDDALLLVPGFADSFLTNAEAFESPVSFPLTVTDNRFYQTIATFTVDNNERVNAGEKDEWRPYKYITPIGQTVEENEGGIDFPLLRYADVLLLTAEAENAINGPTAKAYEALNRVRRRAFNDMEHDLPANLNTDEFSQAILAERKRELALEGQRKDDLVRNGMLESTVEAFNAANPDRAKDYQPHEFIWPIPQKEVDQNPAVSQNSGY